MFTNKENAASVRVVYSGLDHSVRHRADRILYATESIRLRVFSAHQLTATGIDRMRTSALE
jgi:hypothetical protein